MQTFNHAIIISSVQDACLEHAEVLGALQKFEENISSHHFLFSKILKLPQGAKTVLKSYLGIFEINTKIN
jgi:hypothetical protein